MTSDNQCKLIQHCISTHQYLTIKIYDCYILFHRNIVQHSNNCELRLELPPAIIKKIFGSNPLSVVDVTSTRHVDPSLYDIIIYADKSAVYTRAKQNHVEKSFDRFKKWKILPYYVDEDLELLKCCGMSKKDIDLFVQKLNENENIDLFNPNKYDETIQKIIDFTDISTRLNCRLVSRKWKKFVDRSPSWNHVCLTKLSRYVDRALSYFQIIDIRELDLSQSIFQPLKCELKTDLLLLLSLRSLCISTDYPLDFFTLLFQKAPFLQYIKLIQTVHSTFKIPTNQLYDYIHFVICLCQNNLKGLRSLHIQLRSASDQIFLQSSSVTSIPISYEVITC